MNDFISWVVVSYNNGRELPRTLWSMSPHFQQGVSADDYEVIVVDNGSKRPPKARDFADYGLNLTIVSMEDPTHSPVRAVNRGLDLSIGAAMGVTIDGARMMSPGVLRRTREALAIDERAVVATRGRYLGPVLQRHAMRHGYNQKVEDALLDAIDWKNNGYDLFGISTFDEPSRPTWTSPMGETNALFMRRAMWAEMGGFDERFMSIGGGFVNLDAWERAVNLPGAKPIILLGEATFHQFHGGVATNKPRVNVDPMRAEYRAIHGRDHTKPDVPVHLWGTPPPARYPDEVWWEPGRKAADRTAQGPMKGLLNLKSPQLPVDDAGHVIESEELKQAVATARKAARRNARRAAAEAAAAAGGEPATEARPATSGGGNGTKAKKAGGTTGGGKKAGSGGGTKKAGTGGGAKKAGRAARTPKAPPPPPTGLAKVKAALPAGLKGPLKKILGR